MRWLPEEINCSCVWSFWCSELCNVDQTVTVQRESVLDVRCDGSRVILSALLLTLDEYSSWRVGRVVPMISPAVRITLRSLLRSDLVAELNQTEDRLNDGGVELFQQLLWHVELPQLVKDVQPLLSLFHHGLDVIVSLQVLRNCGAQESEWLHCSHSAVHDGEWGESRGILLKYTIISTVLSVFSSRLLRPHQTASSLTSCL